MVVKKDTELNWIKFGRVDSISFIGKETVVLGYGNYIVFVDTAHPEKKDIIYSATNNLKGDGVQCLCTHRSLSCFAIAEKRRKPRILINAFPSFENLRTLDAQQETGYIALRFSEMEYLIALTGLPNYSLYIWNWRTSEKLYSINTSIRLSSQILRVSQTSPIYIAQAAPNERTMVLWEMNMAYKKAVLNENSIVMPEKSRPPYEYAWGFDGDLYFVDSAGNLFSMNPESKKCELALGWKGDEGTSHPCLIWYKGGWVFTGPGKVQFYRRKSPEGWNRVWSFTPNLPLKALLSSTFKDILAGWNEMHELVLIKGETNVECTTVRSYGSDFDFICWVYPVADFFITYGSARKTFTVWNKINGAAVSTLEWNNPGIVNDMKSNPKYPYLVVLQSTGRVSLVNFYDPASPSLLGEVYLSKSSKDMVQFHSSGEKFCVANIENGEFFLIKFSGEPKIEVIATIKLDLKIVHFSLIGESASVQLVVLPMSQLCCRSGQTFLTYTVQTHKKLFLQERDITLPVVISFIVPKTDTEIYCVPHRSRALYIMNVKTGELLKKMVSGHQMKSYSITFDGVHLLTFGFDGIAILRLMGTGQCVTVMAPHHRMERGIKSAIVDPYCHITLSLGMDGTLVCFQYSGTFCNAKLRIEIEALLKSTQFKHLLFIPIAAAKAKSKAREKPSIHGRETSFSVQMESGIEELEEKTWLEIREAEKVQQDERHSRNEKTALVEQLEDLKTELQELLNSNLAAPTNVQLPIQAFDLDKINRRKKIEDGRAEREKERHMQLATIKARDKVSDYIKKLCWESVDVKGRELHGIVSSLTVESYPLLNLSESYKNSLFWRTQRIKLEQHYRTGDYFEPWVPRSASMLQLHLNNKAHISEINVTQTLKTIFEEDEYDRQNREPEKTDKDSPLLWSGTSTHNFIPVSQHHYTQFELCTVTQGIAEIQLIQAEIRSLMIWFNKEFDETYQSKEREVATICEKNNRFRHIINELNFFNFSKDICRTVIIDPQWSPYEQPERMVKVEDKELSVTPYYTPSQERLIKQRQEEAERLRRMMLADDFKEKALVVMMDGVLEKLWENEIKKDVPKPKCMLEREPDQYTDDDLKAIRVYEESVRSLQAERERYRKILEADWAKLINSVRDISHRFDDKLTKLHLLKLKVDSAIGQEVLKMLRIKLSTQEKYELSRKEDNLRDSMLRNEKKIEAIQSELSKLMEILTECRNYHETLQNRNRNLDKNFKKEFPDLSPILCEQLYKISKKRPKIFQKASLFSTLLIDTGKCAVAGTKPDYLTAECIQYLKDIDVLDNYSNAPSSVSEQTWDLMCKLRRAKIDCELKVRACAVDLGEAETTVSAYQKKLKNAKEFHIHLQNEMNNLKQEKTMREEDNTIQLVLKCGLVETPLSGRISDFENSVLVTKATLMEINNIISKAGNQKIKAMRKAANFRKGIIFKEWEHKKLRMEIEDLKSSLSTVENIKVIKELQAILVARARGFTDEKGFLYLEDELQTAKENFKKSQIDLNRQIDDFNEKIDKMNAKNEKLDCKISELNVEVNELNLSIDRDFDAKQLSNNMKRMKAVRYRSKLVQKIQEQHNEILMLQTELELLRLRTFPTLKSKT